MQQNRIYIRKLAKNKSVPFFVIFAVILGLLVPLSLSNVTKASGTTIVLDAFTNASTGSPAGWSIGGNQTPAPVCDGNTQLTMVDGPDAGTDVDRLRLINQCNQGLTGYALYDVAQSTSAGLDIRFNLSIHGFGGTGCPTNPPDNYNSISTGGGSNAGNTCQADGFVFYLKQGSNIDTGGASLGQPGGSLGYSPIYGSGGLSGALLGVGFDAYGNFYQNPYAGSNCSGPSQSDSGLARRSLIVRGPQGADRTTGYCRIRTSADRTVGDRNIGADISNTGIFNTNRSGAAIRITIDTQDTSAGRTNGTGTVYIAGAGTTNWSAVSAFTIFELPAQLNPQTNSTFKFGFVAGTGGGNMYADIWGAGVESIRDLPPPEFVASAFCLSTQENLNVTLQGREGVAPYSYSLQSGSLPSGVTLTSEGILSGTPTSTGSYDFTLRLTDSQSPTARTADRRFQGTVLSSPCDSNLKWTLAGNEVSSPNSETTSCSTGSVSGSSVNGYRILTFRAPDSGNGSCTWTPPTNVFEIETLVVGGGGGGGFDAGGGGGGGGIAFHSSIKINTNNYSITIGGGGAAGPETGTPSQKTGVTGGASSISQPGTSLISANGGFGGKGCHWNGYSCNNADGSNSGGSGGNSSGPSGSHLISGGAGGAGVWTNSSRPDPQSGSDGDYFQTSGALRYYGGGGGGSGASLTPGNGGAGGGASGTTSGNAPANATASTGGGGGGGNGPGSSGGSGIVIIKYAFRTATNVANPVVSVSFSGTNTASMNQIGTVVRQSATLTGSVCGESWTTASVFTLPNGTDSTLLERGKCYRWSYDTGAGFGGTYPRDSSSIEIRSSATSPILIIPTEVTIRVPSVLRSDPRVSQRSMPGVVLTTGESAMLCFYESDQSTLSGIGSVSSSPALKIDIATLGSEETVANSVSISGDRSTALIASGSAANLESTFANTLIYMSGANFSLNKYLLIRSVPIVSGFTSTCYASSSGLYPINSGAKLIPLEPYGLTQTVRKNAIPLK